VCAGRSNVDIDRGSLRGEGCPTYEPAVVSLDCGPLGRG
jgi:hypothetical protein